MHILFSIVIAGAFLNVASFLLSKKNPLFGKYLVVTSSRKDLFFDIVRSGLSDQFDASELVRVQEFISYASGSSPLPERCNAFSQEVIEGLLPQPFWDPSYFPFVSSLEEKAHIIRQELESVMADESLFKADSAYSQTMGDGWGGFRLQRKGMWIESNVKRFPNTYEILTSLGIPLAMRGVMFARQAPRTGVKAHSDGRNFVLTLHLGLKLPRNATQCSITVGGITKHWEQDKALVIDTSFIHSTMNESDQERYVLIVDFWHPETTEAERAALAYIYDARNKFEDGRMEDIQSSYLQKRSKALWDNEGGCLTSEAVQGAALSLEG
eukprot:gene39482-48065_t